VDDARSLGIRVVNLDNVHDRLLSRVQHDPIKLVLVREPHLVVPLLLVAHRDPIYDAPHRFLGPFAFVKITATDKRENCHIGSSEKEGLWREGGISRLTDSRVDRVGRSFAPLSLRILDLQPILNVSQQEVTGPEHVTCSDAWRENW
jgi:hypothetical protein